ncbi:DUF1566 domain-containing protein [Desulfococcaceae bacterium HSG7]|nr:DUF1566 domain-containing protein [Desulfococcaceae bacterium HSG7]
MGQAFKNFIRALALQAPVAGVAAAFWEKILQQPLFAAGLALLYELILLFWSVLGKEVWEKLKPPVIDFTAEWVKVTVLNFFSHFGRRYKEHLIYEHRVFNVRGLRTTGTYTLEIEKIFVELNLAPSNPHQASTNPLEWKTLSGSQPVWGFIRRLKKQQATALAILGPPGCGKTTLMKYITLIFAARKQRRHKVRAFTPILLFLREHVKTITEDAPSLAQLAQACFADQKQFPKLNPPAQWFMRQLRTGKCLVMLDGLDEVPLQHRQAVIAWTDKQIREYPRCRFLLTARPQGYQSAPLTRAHVLEVIPFKPAQVERFIQNWYLANKILSFGGKDDPGVRRDAEREARNLTARLQEKPQLQALTINPLLLTMIANVHNFRGALPERRVELYAEICDVLLEFWQQAKGVPDTLTALQKKVVLQPLAAAMMDRKIRAIGTRDALALIEGPLIQVGYAKDNIPSFLQNLQENSGLFLENEAGVWSFAHLTFQEYFCAVHWNKTGQAVNWNTEQWQVYIEDNWWHETLRLYAAQSDATLLVNACLQSRTRDVLTLAANIAEESLKLEETVRDDIAGLLKASQVIQLRAEPLAVSEDEFNQVFKLDEKLRPLEYIQNDFEAHNEVITDHATGLMWQQSGSDNELNYDEAQDYVKELNRNQFAGYNDWRLPTIPELISLLESEKQSNRLYINPIFDKKQKWCWSSDTVEGSSGLAWGVGFSSGLVYTTLFDGSYYVRVVRAG